jgi:hypothetical protein
LWFEVVFCRSAAVRELSGGVSGLFKAVVGAFFNNGGHDFSTSGITLKLPSGRFLQLFLTLRVVIADEAALHALYGCKGSSGLKPCLLCQNIFNFNTTRDIVAADGAGFAQHHVCHETSKLVLQTPDTVTAIIGRLAAGSGTMTKANFNELQTRLGWNHVPGGVMSDASTRIRVMPSGVAVYDWMHVFFVGGVFNVHMGNLVAALKPHGITYATLNTYVCEWHWPKAFDAKFTLANGPFAGKRSASSWEAGSLKATASECLALVPVLAQFFDRLAANSLTDAVKEHARCMLLLVAVIETIRKASRCNINAGELRAASEAYLADFKKLYGPECMITKFHAVLHFSLFLERWAYLPNCWVLERKHKAAKRFANEIRNTSGRWEASVARDVTGRHVDTLQSRSCSVGAAAYPLDPLVKPRQAVCTILMEEFPGLEEHMIKTTKAAVVSYCEKVCVGDVIFVRPSMVGELLFIAQIIDGDIHELIFQLRVWVPIEETGPRAAKYRRSDRLELVQAQEAMCSLMWGGGGDMLTVLRPTHFDVAVLRY